MKKNSKTQIESYLFYGVVLPERAQLTHKAVIKFSHLDSKKPGKATISIILNQLVVSVETDQKWDVLDLRNVVKTILQNQLAMLGYLKGYAYDFEITRVLNPNHKIDYVFGIGIPCIEKRGKSVNLDQKLSELYKKTTGLNGVYINRCFNDLIFSMKYADDTGFYCYRAIESLRHHCSSVTNLSEANDKQQWEKFREVSSVKKSKILYIKDFADPTRHGGTISITSKNRENIFEVTWNIVESYLENID
jgi:hypothetical protein